MCREFVVTLPATGSAAAAGRAEIESTLTRSFSEPGRLVDDAVLVGSELLTNALRAGAPSVVLRVESHVDEVVVGVRDDMPGRPQALPEPEPTEIAGRGLAVIARVAAEWGVREKGTGKEVWVRLPVPAGVAARFNCEHAPT
ncbi:ATP-binding protein [Jatrophihabitans sp. YIM 134969]